MKGGNGNQFQYGGPVNFSQQSQQSQQPQQQQQRPSPAIYGNPARSKHTLATPMANPNVPSYNLVPMPITNQRPNIMNNQMRTQQVQSHLANMQHQQLLRHHQEQLRDPAAQMMVNFNNTVRTGKKFVPICMLLYRVTNENCNK